jgi:hypothetical protein
LLLAKTLDYPPLAPMASVARHLPLAIMGVRMRVRHQSCRRARGTTFFPVSPELF